jgi:hypothetical protein
LYSKVLLFIDFIVIVSMEIHPQIIANLSSNTVKGFVSLLEFRKAEWVTPIISDDACRFELLRHKHKVYA